VRRAVFSALTLVVLVLLSAQSGVQRSAVLGQAGSGEQLKIYVGPPRVLADNRAYEAIFVQLQNSQGVPVRATGDVVVYLSSSLTYIGSVDSVVTVPSGETYAVANFYSTYTPGTTTITASASGFVTVQELITTVGPVPSSLEVYVLPLVLPADGGSYRSILVQLQDFGGLPAKAPIGDVTATLSCSNVAVGTVDPSIVIPAGTSYAVSTFSTTFTAGSAVVTAIASGYSTGQAQVTTQAVGGSATKLKVYVGPPKVPADGAPYPQVAVQLQDSSGTISRAGGVGVTVFLSSSDSLVGTIGQSITIPSGATYDGATFHSTYMSGSTVITAVATNCESSNESLTTVGPIPSKLAVYCVPPSLPADAGSYDDVLVQLQDSGGNPARDPGSVSVYLFSSMPQAGNVSLTTTIPYGETYSTANFSSTYFGNSTVITALTPGYETGQATVTTYVIDLYTLDVSVTAQPSIVNSSGQTNVTVYVAYNGLSPAAGATINLKSDNGGSFSGMTDEGNGYYTSVFTAPVVTQQAVCTILATASKLAYTSGQASVQVTVNPISLNVTVTAQPSMINSSAQTNVTVYVAYNGLSPAAGATINLTSDNGGNFSAVTDEENGYYTSTFTAPSVTKQTMCTVQANASKTGYNSGQGNVQVTVNSTVTTGTILVVITETNGNPISGANVSLTAQPSGVLSMSGITDEAGFYAFNNVSAGSYTVSAEKSGYESNSQAVVLEAGKTASVTISLTSKPSTILGLSPPILIAIIVVVVIIAVLLVVMAVRRRRAKKPISAIEEEEGEQTEEQKEEREEGEEEEED
jgi:adhesin/invasin